MQVYFDWSEDETTMCSCNYGCKSQTNYFNYFGVTLILLRNFKKMYYFGRVSGEAGGGEARLFVSVSPISDTVSQPHNCFTQRDAML